MTNLLLENTNESKVDELIDALLNEHKQTLLRDEQEERDILDYIQMDIDIKENHSIPYYSEKYGVDLIDKEYFNITLEFLEELEKIRSYMNNNPNNEKESEIRCNEKVDEYNNRLEPLSIKLAMRRDKYDFEISFWIKEHDSLKVIGECLGIQKYNQENFKFHGDTFIKLMDKHTELESELKTIKEDYEKSKQQCSRIIKKINHLFNKTSKKTGTSYLPTLKGTYGYSPFIKTNSDNNSISLDVK